MKDNSYTHSVKYKLLINSTSFINDSKSNNMSDELRLWLRRVDGTAPAIQGAAAQLMKHYDRSATTAVNEWRNAVMSASQRNDQLLPLLYVANEVLQSVRKYLPNQGQGLRVPALICPCD